MSAFENIAKMNVYLNKLNVKHIHDIHSFHRILNRETSKIEEMNFNHWMSLFSHLQDSIYCSSDNNETINEKYESCFRSKKGKETFEKLFGKYDNFEGFDLTNPKIYNIVKLIMIFHCSWDNYYPEFRPDFSDDFFEWSILWDLYGSSLSKQCIGAHDAWTLALMYYAEKVDNKWKLSPKQEKGCHSVLTEDILNDIPVVNVTDETSKYPNVDHLGPKDLVKIEFVSSIDNTIQYIQLEKRRLTQLVDYSNLSEEEQIKDQVPVIVSHYIRKLKDGNYANILMY
jgi:hypothetical protein